MPEEQRKRTRGHVSEFQLANELSQVIANHIGPRRYGKLPAEDRRDVSDRCLELARHAAALAADHREPRT